MTDNYAAFQLLKPDELEVEFIIRGISSNRVGYEKQLLDCLVREQSDSSKIPIDCHACSSPELEAEAIKRSVASLLSNITDLNKNYSLSQNKVLLARNTHWFGRAQRFKYSFGEIGGVKSSIDALERQKRVLVKNLKQSVPESDGIRNINPTIEGDPLPSDDSLNVGNVDNDQIKLDNLDSKTSRMSNDEQPKVIDQTLPTQPETTEFEGTPGLNSVNPPVNQNQIIPQQQTFHSASEQYYHSHSLSSIQHNQDQHFQNHNDLSHINPPGIQTSSSNDRRRNISNFIDPYTGISQNQLQSKTNQQFSVPNYFNERYIPKWSIKFDGTNKPLDAQEFVFRLESMAIRERFPILELVNIVHRFLSGNAERWYWIFLHNYPNATWPQMKQALVSQFSFSDTDFEIRRRIENRHQKVGESFDDFLLEVQSMNVKLIDRFSEFEMLRILRENMNPNLKEKTLSSHFNSVENLRVLCRQFERLWASSYARNTVTPVRNRVSSLDFNNSNANFYDVQAPNSADYPSWSTRPTNPNQDVCYGEFQISALNNSDMNYSQSARSLSPTKINQLSVAETSNSRYSGNLEISAIHPNYIQSNTASKESNLVCWNCRDIGHRYHDCLKDFLEIFCFGCGNHGVRKPNCFVCKKRASENFVPNVVKSGMVMRSGQTPNRPKPIHEDAASNTEPNKYK